MKKILLILCLFPILVFSQKSYKIPADSTILNNIGSGKNELVIRNATSNITGGVLTNLGNGVTAFVLGGSARVVDTIYKNSTKDSIVFTISGIRYAVKDSFNLNTDSQTLSISNDTLTISGGNSVVLPVYVQADSSTINSYDVLNSQNTPPVSPSTGDVYLVGNSPSGAWVGQAKDIAEWNGSSWDFTDGVQGDFLYNATNALTYIFRSGNWVQTTGIPALNNGNTISSGLRIGTNNARSLTFETNNVNRGRFDSIGRFHVYNLPTASTGDTFVTKSDLGGKLTKVGQSTFLSGGAFIPLIGTVSGSPVTGDLVFFDGANTANFTLSFSDGLQIYNDKNTNVFSIDGTNSTSTGIILQSDKDGVLDIGSSNVSSRGIVSANDYSANITDLDYTQKIYVDNAISSNRKVDTSYIFRNATRDSICMTTIINGNTYRSCAFDSVGGGGGGASLSGLTAATATNIINNGNYKQEWQWNSLANNTGLKLSSTSGGLLNTTNKLFECTMSGAMAGTGNSSYAGYFKNTQTLGGGIGLYAEGTGTAIDAVGSINIQNGNLQLGGSSGALFYISSGTTFLQASTGQQLILVSQNATAGNINFQCSAVATDIGFQIAKKTLNQHYVFGLGGARYNGNYVSASSTSACIMERNANKIIFSANSGLPGGGTAIYVPNNILTISGGATEATSNVGIGTTSPVASAKLEVSSTTSGFLPPRMTATQASAISTPAQGLLLFVTDTNGTFTSVGWWGYNGSTWEKLNN